MYLENIYEAKAFIIFLIQEKNRHQEDIERIDIKIKKILKDWDF